MTESVDLQSVTDAQQKTWSEGDFSRVGGLLVVVAENLAEAADICGGERVLDIACGAGNGAIAAARRSWIPSVGLDYVPALLERGRERAEAERLEVEFVEGDAQDLPFEDGSFDVTMSIFGAMFAPDQQKTADEILRVTKPGGRIAMANWTPEGYVGQMFKTIAGHTKPPPGLDPPVLWGDEGHLKQLFGDGIETLGVNRRMYDARYLSPEQMLDYFRTYFGPTMVAFETVGSEGAPALESDLIELCNTGNVSDRSLVIPSEYLEVVAVRR